MHRTFCALLLIGAAATPAANAAQDLELDGAPFAGAATLDRATLVARVLERNPSVAAARLAWEAARQRPAQARALADPTLRYEIAPLSAFSSDVRFGNVLAGEQMLPWPGKRRLRGAAAEAEADVAAEELAALRLDLALAAVDGFADWYVVHRALAINDAHRALVAELLDVATGRYSAGLVPQQDPLQAEVELAHVAHERVAIERRRGEVAARLNALLHRPPAAPLPPPPARLPADGDLEGALPDETTAVHRPELAAADAEIRALESELALARLERRPDFGVMGTYSSMWMETEHQWMAGVSVNVPIRRERLAAAEAEADGRLAAARARRAALATTIAAEIETARLRLDEAHHVVVLYESRLVPASRDRVEAARTAFESSQSDFQAVIEAQRNLRNVELDAEEAAAELVRRRAELERSLGRSPAVPVPAAPAATDASSPVPDENGPTP